MVVLGLAVIIGVVGLQILDDSVGGSKGATGSTSGVTLTTGAVTSTTAAVRANSQVRVKVYNASGVQGRAQTLTDQLRASGYNMQTPATVATTRKGTVVECVPGFEREGAALASSGVGNSATTAKYPSSPPAGASDADCLVVIGTT